VTLGTRWVPWPLPLLLLVRIVTVPPSGTREPAGGLVAVTVSSSFTPLARWVL
jgi:hypothetical protein